MLHPLLHPLFGFMASYLCSLSSTEASFIHHCIHCLDSWRVSVVAYHPQKFLRTRLMRRTLLLLVLLLRCGKSSTVGLKLGPLSEKAFKANRNGSKRGLSTLRNAADLHLLGTKDLTVPRSVLLNSRKYDELTCKNKYSQSFELLLSELA